MNEAQKRANQKYKEKNKDKISKYNKDYYEKNREMIKQQRQEFKENNLEAVKERRHLEYLRRKERLKNGECTSGKSTSGKEE